MAQTPTEIPMAEAKRVIQDLFEPKASIYWADFLFNDLLGWAAFVWTVKSPNFSLIQCLSFLVASLALYRAVLFVHELSHLKKGTFTVFRQVWNLLCGFPLLLPSFIYVGVHTEHHKQKIYGTHTDPEYFPFALAKPYRIPLFPLTMVAAPAAFILRFLILAPLSYVFWPLRKPLWILGSSLAIGGDYRRPLPDRQEKWTAGVQEFMAFAYVTTAFVLMAEGVLSWKLLVVWYLVAVFILVTNAFRSLVAHCDRNPPNHVMSLGEQFLDSTDIPGNPLLTPLWAPVGLRFHATHHLFMGLPYHSLGEAYRRLTKALPDSIYPLAYRKSMWEVLVQLWKEAAHNRGAGLAGKPNP
jgi:fatty acid desaturase